MISCRFATSLHTEASEGTLTGARRLLYAFHMGVCPHCEAYVKGLDQTEAALEALPKEEAPEALKAALSRKLGERR